MNRMNWWIVGMVAALAVGAGTVVGVRVVRVQRAEAALTRRLEQAQALTDQKRYPEAIAAYKQLIAASSEAPQARQARLELIELSARLDRVLEAREHCLTFLQLYPGDPAVPQVTERLGELNLTILMSPIPTPESVEYVVQSGDSLGQIAKTHNTTVEFLIKTNRLKSATLRPSMRLKVPNHVRWSVVVDKSLSVLTLKANDHVLKTYRVATGNNNITPVGTFRVINKVVNPVWYREGQAIPPDSPENILGSRWMGFDKPGYGIHGTIQPETIGQQVTAGCVRMLSRDVEELFDILPLDADVTIVD